jgi:hypothetical protein
MAKITTNNGNNEWLKEEVKFEIRNSKSNIEIRKGSIRIPGSGVNWFRQIRNPSIEIRKVSSGIPGSGVNWFRQIQNPNIEIRKVSSRIRGSSV